jgi:hypothetical protein
VTDPSPASSIAGRLAEGVVAHLPNGGAT